MIKEVAVTKKQKALVIKDMTTFELACCERKSVLQALSKLLTQMTEWRGNSALIGELVD